MDVLTAFVFNVFIQLVGLPSSNIHGKVARNGAVAGSLIPMPRPLSRAAPTRTGGEPRDDAHWELQRGLQTPRHIRFHGA